MSIYSVKFLAVCLSVMLQRLCYLWMFSSLLNIQLENNNVGTNKVCVCYVLVILPWQKTEAQIHSGHYVATLLKHHKKYSESWSDEYDKQLLQTLPNKSINYFLGGRKSCRLISSTMSHFVLAYILTHTNILFWIQLWPREIVKHKESILSIHLGNLSFCPPITSPRW